MRLRGRTFHIPLHLQVLALLMRCVPNSDPQSEPRVEMDARFRDVEDARKLDSAELTLCISHLRWIERALGGRTMSLRWVV